MSGEAAFLAVTGGFFLVQVGRLAYYLFADRREERQRQREWEQYEARREETVRDIRERWRGQYGGGAE